MLSDHEIRRFMAMGAIVIDPFRDEALNPNSYDLTVGPHVARLPRDEPPHMKLRPAQRAGSDVFELYDYSKEGEFTLEPHESVLCHTNEFAGGTGLVNPVSGEMESVAINTQMRATSTAGRWNITACRCAGHGDVGYFDRWTMEVQNASHRSIVIPVGAVISQLVFFKVATPTRVYQDASGNYQKHRELEKLREEWTPQRMLPKKLKQTDFWKRLYGLQPTFKAGDS